MDNIGIINCKYHPTKLNISWCSNCGNPICEECIAKIPRWIMGFGHPDICPHCKQEKLRFYLKISLILCTSIIIVSFVIQYFINSLIGFLIAVVGTFGVLLYTIIIYLKERKDYQKWKTNIDERTISNVETQNLIQNQKLTPCKYHDNMPSINKCDDCGIDICINCSVLHTRFLGAYISCLECFWKKRKRDLKIFLWLFGVPFILLLALFVSLTIAFWGSNPLSFYIVVPSVCLFEGIIFIFLSILYTKTKKKYIKWTDEVAAIVYNHQKR